LSALLGLEFLEVKPALIVFVFIALIQKRNPSYQTGFDGIRPPPSLKNPPAAGGKLDVAAALLLVRLPLAELFSTAAYFKKSARRGQHTNRSAAGALISFDICWSQPWFVALF
jgi:hypothetical protein